MAPRNIVEVMGNRAHVAEPGHLGTAFEAAPYPLADTEMYAVDLPENATVVVYCRKTDDTLEQAVRYCNETGATLLFLSSKIDFPSDEDASNFSRIDVPNAALTVIDYAILLDKVAKEKYPGWIATITEHHQPAKVDTSGTALTIAKQREDPTRIISIRDYDMTTERYGYDIPEEFKDGYAVHSTTFTNPDDPHDVSDPYEIVIAGREPYVEGVINILRALQEHPEAFEKGMRYVAIDLVKNGLVKTASANKQDKVTLDVAFSEKQRLPIFSKRMGSTALEFIEGTHYRDGDGVAFYVEGDEEEGEVAIAPPPETPPFIPTERPVKPTPAENRHARRARRKQKNDTDQ